MEAGDPADDLMTAMIAGRGGRRRPLARRVRRQVLLLYIAGHETTVNLIGNGMLALLRNPDQLARLRDRSGARRNAVEELLRYDSPVQMTRRITLQRLSVRGKMIPAGAFVSPACRRPT